jgi:hypothetical protein
MPGAVTKSTAIEPHLRQGAAGGVRGKRGRLAQAIGRSRGGWTTKVHALIDAIGRPYAPMLTAGNVSDVKAHLSTSIAAEPAGKP